MRTLAACIVVASSTLALGCGSGSIDGAQSLGGNTGSDAAPPGSDSGPPSPGDTGTTTTRPPTGDTGTTDAAPPPTPDGSRMRFDGKGHFLMHGIPRFVLGAYDSGLGYTTDETKWEQMLFAPGGDRALQGIPLNLYLNYHYGQATIAALDALMDVLLAHDMMYLQTVNCFDTGSYTRYDFDMNHDDQVVAFAKHEAAAGYYIMDECVDALLGETIDHHAHLLSLDPQGISFAATLAAMYRDPKPWVPAADMIGSDPYPMYGAEPAAGYSHFKVADHIARLRHAVDAARPVTAVLQFFQFTSDSRFPTYDEMRAHAYMSIVEGAQGIFWWELGPGGLRAGTSPSTVATMMGYLKTLTNELHDLEPALLAPDDTTSLVGNSTASADRIAFRIAALKHDIDVDPLYSDKEAFQAEIDALDAGDESKSYMLDQGATVRTRVKTIGAVSWLFAYNYTNGKTPVTFTWKSAPGTVTVVGEGRTIASSGSTFSDSFDAYAAHVYRIGG